MLRGYDSALLTFSLDAIYTPFAPYYGERSRCSPPSRSLINGSACVQSKRGGANVWNWNVQQVKTKFLRWWGGPSRDGDYCGTGMKTWLPGEKTLVASFTDMHLAWSWANVPFQRTSLLINLFSWRPCVTAPPPVSYDWTFRLNSRSKKHYQKALSQPATSGREI